MTASRPLGDYLRARRELILPEDVGLEAAGGRRRVAGLRRSEVAQLAGISNEYYIKLEQWSEAHPTDQVLNALSRALQLDTTARSYMHSLARIPSAGVATEHAEEPIQARWLIDSWPMTAAFIHDRYCNIIAVNALMRALVPAYQETVNCLAALLLDPSIRALHGAEWEGLTSRSVAMLRTNAGLHPEQPRLQELVAQLTRDSERFRELWRRNDVLAVTEGVHNMTHPTLGPLAPHFARLPLAGTQDHSIFLYYPEPGSRTAEAFAELAGVG